MKKELKAKIKAGKKVEKAKKKEVKHNMNSERQAESNLVPRTAWV